MKMDDGRKLPTKQRSRSKSPSRVNSPITRRRRREMEEECASSLADEAFAMELMSKSDDSLSEHMRKTTIRDNIRDKLRNKQNFHERTSSGDKKQVVAECSKTHSFQDNPKHLYGLDKETDSDHTLHTIKKEPGVEYEENSLFVRSLSSLIELSTLLSKKTIIFAFLLIFGAVIWSYSTARSRGEEDKMKSIEEIRHVCFAKVDSISSQLRKQDETIQLLLTKLSATSTAHEDMYKKQTQQINLLEVNGEYLENTAQRFDSELQAVVAKTKLLEDKLEGRDKTVQLQEGRLGSLAEKMNLLEGSLSTQTNLLVEEVVTRTTLLEEKMKNLVNQSHHIKSLGNKMEILQSYIGSVEAKRMHGVLSLQKKLVLLNNKTQEQLFEKLDKVKVELSAETGKKQDDIQLEMTKVKAGISSVSDGLRLMKNKTMRLIQKEIRKAKQEEQWNNSGKSLCMGEECKYRNHNMLSNIQHALEMERADTLGVTDYALKSAGGEIHRHSETYLYGSAVVSFLGLPLYHDPTLPNAVITPTSNPGDCWFMKGSQGFLVIKLAVAIQPNMVTLEHLDKKIDHYSKDRYIMAPKDCEIYGWLDAEGVKKVFLGSFSYEREGSAIQTFTIKKKGSKPITYVELKILSNHGNSECTCIYRFRVHGEPYRWSSEEDEDF